MAYTPQNWVDGSDGGTPITAARLTHMEDGIEDADVRLTATQSGLTTVQNDLATAQGDITDLQDRSTALEGSFGYDTPARHGATAWTYDPALAVNTTQLTGGTLYLSRLDIPVSGNNSKIYWWVGNTGASPVTNQNIVGLFSSAGTLLASAVVDSDISSATLKTTSISTQALVANTFVWVGFLFNASVPPTLTRASGWTGVGQAASLGYTASQYRFAINGTGRTSMPSSITPGSNTATDFAGPWCAVGQ